MCICKILFQHSHWQSRISIYQKWKVGIDLYWSSVKTAECLFNLILFNHLLAKWFSAGVCIWYLWMISIHNTANRYVFAWGKLSQGLWEPRCCRYQLSKWTSHQIFLLFHFLDNKTRTQTNVFFDLMIKYCFLNIFVKHISDKRRKRKQFIYQEHQHHIYPHR